MRHKLREENLLRHENPFGISADFCIASEFSSLSKIVIISFIYEFSTQSLSILLFTPAKITNLEKFNAKKKLKKCSVHASPEFPLAKQKNYIPCSLLDWVNGTNREEHFQCFIDKNENRFISIRCNIVHMIA